jgi:hypothetical protein
MHRRTFLLGASAGLGALAAPRVARAEPAPRNFLIVFAQGAWDVTHCLDPKRAPACDVPAGRVTAYPSGVRVLTDPSRPGVQKFFDANARHCAVVNGLWVGSVAHLSARARVLTGTRDGRSPDVAAIFAATAAEARPRLALPYVDLGGGAFAGPLASVMGRVGATNQLVTLIDRAKAPRGAAGGFVPDEREQALIDGFVARRAADAAGQPGAAAVPGFRAGLERAAALRRDPLLRGMSVGKAASLAQQGELATSLLRGGVACAAFLDSRLDWDTHDDIADQSTSHDRLFAELAELAARLDAAGLLAHTTVAVLSEFARTPKLNDSPQPGKDHWPVTSALLFGGGVRPGTYGATDDGLGALRLRMDDGTPADTGRLLQFDNFAAGLLESLGVSSRRWLPNAEPFQGPFA